MCFISRPSQFLKLTQVLSFNISGVFSLVIPTFCSRNHTSTALFNFKPFNSKISDYMRNGRVQEAQKLFDEMPHRNVVTWNALIRGYFQNGQFDKAVCLFRTMPVRDIVSYNTVISGLMQWGDIEGAREVFDCMHHRDVVSWNSMIGGYIRNGLIGEGRRTFDEMPEKNVVSWNLVTGGLVNCGEFDLAKEYFDQMDIRDVVSCTIMVSGLASVGRIVEARELFEEMPIRDFRAWNAMLVGYIENSYMDAAEALFLEMPHQDLDSWKDLIDGFLSSRRVFDAMRLFRVMPQKCQKTWNSIMLYLIRDGLVKQAHAFLEKTPYSDIKSCTNMIVGYFGIGEVGTAVKIFELMPTRDATMWNASIFGLGQNDHGEEGLQYFIRMKGGGPSPDKATFTTVLTVCSDLPTLHLGRQTHGQVIKMGFSYSVAVSNAMITMYERCGNMHCALLEFSSMENHDIISWNSIICGFAHHGIGGKALEMFERMISSDVNPNQITFVGVLSACSHAGLVDHGRHYFNLMKYKCSIQPTIEHYTCIIDMLGRFGLIDEAMSFLDKMREDGIEIPASVWGALLGACRIHKNIEVGKVAGERVLEMEPYNAGVYLILAEMFQSNGRKEDAERMWLRMKEKGIKKQPGCSWIEVNNRGYAFLAGDTSHPEFSKFCCIFYLMNIEMKMKFLKSNSAVLQQLQNIWYDECCG